MNSNLFIGGFPYDATAEDLTAHFSTCGTVKSVKILLDRETGRSRGLGFLEMSSEAEARAAIAKLHGSTMSARKIFVSEARARENAPGTASPEPGFVERRSGKDRRKSGGAPGMPEARRSAEPAKRDWKSAPGKDWKSGPKKEWSAGGKKEWTPGPKRDWKAAPKKDWQGGPKKEWKPGPKKEWKPAGPGGDKKPWAAKRPGGDKWKGKPRRDGGGFRGR